MEQNRKSYQTATIIFFKLEKTSVLATSVEEISEDPNVNDIYGALGL